MRLTIAVLTALIAFPAVLVAATPAEIPPTAPPDTTAAPGESPHDQATRLLHAGQVRAAEAAARAWLAASPDEPEAYVLLANVLMSEIPTFILDAGEAGPGDLVLVEPETGEAKGRIAEPKSVPDDEAMRALAHEAMTTLAQATTRFPDRLDIWFGLAHLQQVMGDFEGQISTLRRASARVKETPSTIAWTGGAKPPEPAAALLAKALGSYWEELFDLDIAAQEDVLRGFARFHVDVEPTSSTAWNELAITDTMRADWKAAREHFMEALEHSPNDPTLMLNIAQCSIDSGDAVGAKDWLEKVLRLDPDPEYVARARERLATLQAPHAAGSEVPR